jgi:hypothetical protein
VKTVIIHFTSGKLLSLNMPAETADKTISGMNVDPSGTTLITSDNGNAYLINRAQVTHVTVEP